MLEPAVWFLADGKLVVCQKEERAQWQHPSVSSGDGYLVSIQSEREKEELQPKREARTLLRRGSVRVSVFLDPAPNGN